jgi:hypothetical protein
MDLPPNERAWKSNGIAARNVTTEEMRIAMQRYRSFFGRLLRV